MMKNKYILKIKDIPLVYFELFDNIYGDVEANINKIENAGVLPLGLELDNNGLLKWLKNRNIPKNREFVDEILQSLGVKKNDLIGLIDVGMSLSLNDSYWVVKENFEGLYKDYNLYENDFNKAIGLVAYTGHGHSESIGTLPELTTGGTLRKAWRNIYNGIYLFKGARKGYSNGGLEPYMEYYASQIAKVMELDYISYDLEMWQGELASTCRLFTDINTDYIPASALVTKYNGLKDVVEVFKSIGEQAYQKFCSMMVFDAIICNTDRHLGNFGVLRDNKSGKIKDICPIFDNGLSLMDEANEKDFNDLKSAINYCNNLSPVIGKSFEKNVAIFKGKLQQKQLLKLVGFKFTRHELYNLSDEKLKLIEELIQHRINLMLNIKNKDTLDELEVKTFNKEFRFEDLPLNLKDKALEEFILGRIK